MYFHFLLQSPIKIKFNQRQLRDLWHRRGQSVQKLREVFSLDFAELEGSPVSSALRFRTEMDPDSSILSTLALLKVQNLHQAPILLHNNGKHQDITLPECL